MSRSADNIISIFSMLFDALRLYRAKVWDINVAVALRQLISEIRSKGSVNFEHSGVALLSSAIIYRRKTEEILRLEEPPDQELENQEGEFQDIQIIPLDIPLRTSHPVIISKDLFSSLVEILTRILEESRKNRPEDETSPVLLIPDSFLDEIDQRIEDLDRQLRLVLSVEHRVKVVELLRHQEQIEIIRRFIVLLFLLTRLEYALVREEDDLWIVMSS